MKRGKTFIICGPSGVGKGTVVARLLASDPTLYFSVSATTRAPRHGEVDGVHYHFLTMEQFEDWIAKPWNRGGTCCWTLKFKGQIR